MEIFNCKKLLDTLVANDALEQTMAVALLQKIITEKKSTLTEIINHGKVDEASLMHAVAHQMKLPLLDVTTISTTNIPMKTLEANFMRQEKVLPLRLTNKELLIATSNPERIDAINNTIKNLGLSMKAVLVENNKLEPILMRLLPQQDTPKITSSIAKKAISNFSHELSDRKLDKIDLQRDEVNRTDTSEFPAVRFINNVILDSIRRGASDIHFEPFENIYRIRIRIDGVLYELTQPDAALAPRLSTRLKVMADLDISERRVPQDGRFKINLTKGETIGFRVNTCPTLFGEKIVLRILDPQTVKVGVDGLGFEDEQKKMFLEAIHKNQGMILVTGPTGSGKTVTLYTALNLLNSVEKNISTAEDPVEIYLPGINQVNINPKTGLDFSVALRAFLRQDPDVIMLGEIRDHDTAEIGMKAAQTGHLVLSTLHTNSAAETLTRMENMGIAAFNIATSVSLVIAQRLVRQLCKHCKQPQQLTDAILLKQGFDNNEIANLTIYKPIGCDKCTSGYKGRLAIFETLKLTSDMSDIIMNEGSSIDIYNKAIDNDMLDLRHAGLNKVRKGITSLEEINRVTS